MVILVILLLVLAVVAGIGFKRARLIGMKNQLADANSMSSSAYLTEAPKNQFSSRPQAPQVTLTRHPYLLLFILFLLLLHLLPSSSRPPCRLATLWESCSSRGTCPPGTPRRWRTPCQPLVPPAGPSRTPVSPSTQTPPYLRGGGAPSPSRPRSRSITSLSPEDQTRRESVKL